MGALVVELENGTRFSVGTGLSDEERRSPPPVGAIITFRYQELSDGGVPRFPSFIGVRDDVRWKGEVTAAAQPAPAPAQPTAPTAAPAANGAIRRFELVEGTTSKFWEIELRDVEHTVRYGRIGTAGQARTKAFPDATAAAADAARLVEEKTAKGYAEASSG